MHAEQQRVPKRRFPLRVALDLIRRAGSVNSRYAPPGLSLTLAFPSPPPTQARFLSPVSLSLSCSVRLCVFISVLP
jgi:hypothetical protein